TLSGALCSGIRAAGLSLPRAGLLARLCRPGREDALDDLEVELRVPIGRIHAQRLAIRVARVLVPTHAEERVPAVVLRDRAELQILSLDGLAVLRERPRVLGHPVERVRRVDGELGRIGLVLL